MVGTLSGMRLSLQVPSLPSDRSILDARVVELPSCLCPESQIQSDTARRQQLTCSLFDVAVNQSTLLSRG